MSSKINFHHIALLQHHLIPGVGRIMRRTMIKTQPARESHATLDVIALLQALMACQRTNRILDALRDLRQGLSGLDILLGILADLAVDLGALPVLLQPVIVHAVEISLLLAGGAVRILILVLDDLAFGELVIGEERRERNTRRVALHLSGALLLLGLALLLLFRG